MALPLFAVTLFVSAFLLFLVQPMIGKMILPRLGGAPQVWNTTMMFFQTALLAGYAYTHTVSTRLPLRRQLLVHGLLLFIPFLILLPLPFNISGWVPPPGANPIFSTLGLLTVVVGLPFFVVATSAPLLQKWFAATGHPASKDPYFLYGASNLGSMLALLAYPFLVEPFLLLKEQAWTWAIGYGLLLALVLVCVALVWAVPPSVRLALSPLSEEPPPAPATPPTPESGASMGVTAGPPPAPAPQSPATAIKKPPRHFPRPGKEAETVPTRMLDEVTTWRKLRWVGLAAVPSSLMLGVTTHITIDLSPIAMVWLIPLTLYLLSFILVFSRWPVVWTEKPHQVMLYLHPVALGSMIFYDALWTSHDRIQPLIFFLSLGFFWTAMVCHGELARDRPGTKHLTEFYLLMSVGGALGGIFNGLLAPVLFPGVWEYPIAIVLAGFLRPPLRSSGWTDDLVGDFLEQPASQSHHPKKGQKHPVRVARAEKNPSFHYTLDVALPAILLVLIVLFSVFAAPRPGTRALEDNRFMVFFLLFGVPLMISCFYFGRPLRYGLAVFAVVISHQMYTHRGEGSEFSTRSYFGVIRVVKSAQEMPNSSGELKYHYYTQLMHGTTDHGMNFLKPDKKEFVGNPLEDYSRLATTYYHQLGPVGRAMEKFNWFKDKVNYYSSDARMPASLWGMGFLSMGPASLPVGQLGALWSEPPYATIGLGTGTMASYARPYQHMHFYEIDNVIRRLSLPGPDLQNLKLTSEFKASGKTYFTYLQGALHRGSNLQVLMGDARLRMALPYKNYYQNIENSGGPENFYHLMVVDAFSSDAIPVHLITKEAIEMYFKKLTHEGVLCVHTSNRHVDLVKVVADVAQSITWKDKDGVDRHLECRRGHDLAPGGRGFGHYTSEWVIVARDAKYLEHLTEPEGYQDKVQVMINEGKARGDDLQYWQIPTINYRYIWTDDYSNLPAVLRW